MVTVHHLHLFASNQYRPWPSLGHQIHQIISKKIDFEAASTSLVDFQNEIMDVAALTGPYHIAIDRSVLTQAKETEFE